MDNIGEEGRARGFGNGRPIADNDTDLGRVLNRWIEVARAGCTR